MRELVVKSLEELGLEYEVKEEVEEILAQGSVVYYWDPDLQDELEAENLMNCNVLELSEL